MSINTPLAQLKQRTVSGARRSGRPSRDEAAGLREEVLKAARELFLNQGFAATSVQQIAELVGATKRTLYVKVGDKETLFHAVISGLLQDWRYTVDAAGSSRPLRERLEQIGRDMLAVMLAPDMVRLNRVMLSEAYRSPSLVEMLTEQIEHGPILQLVRLLAEARGGAGAPSRSDEVAARLFYDMVTASPLRVALTGRKPSFEMSHTEWVQEAIQGLCGSSARPPKTRTRLRCQAGQRSARASRLSAVPT